ncbi:MAG TPA: quinol:electron acceptor oxidoreductase subunit ActD, partial [Bryobacteraceae bacterium]|nr:quinol:electron acceptor oxidoreductase subunit ActD [Bryobacteraceae bacterium]
MPTATSAAQVDRLHGVMAEFDHPDRLLEAATRAHDAGYREMDAYTPMPIEGLAEAIGFRRTMVEQIVFVAGILGATG